jgi:hypothetical protein
LTAPKKLIIVREIEHIAFSIARVVEKSNQDREDSDGEEWTGLTGFFRIHMPPH